MPIPSTLSGAAWVSLLAAAWLIPALAGAPKDGESTTYQAGAIDIIDPWAKSVIGETHNAKIFFEFRNRSAESDRLLSATTALATGPTLMHGPHEKPITEIEIPPGGAAFELSTAGYYIELTGLEVPLTMGKQFPLTLQFARAGEVRVTITSRFHSPQLARRIREAAQRGDVEELKKLN